jgi:glutamine synthetase
MKTLDPTGKTVHEGTSGANAPGAGASGASAVEPVPGPTSGPLPAGRLERALGKPRTEWTVEDLVRFVRGNDVRLVSLMHVGGDGWLKTLDFVPANEAHLVNILTGGERADGSSLFAGLPSGASDIMLRPRLQSAFLDPFSPVPTLAVLCGHAGRDGEPLPESPDTVVRKAHARVVAECGVDLWALGEVEYFLGAAVDPDDTATRPEDRGYHATSPFVFGETLRREALVALGEIGVPVKYGHSEVGVIDRHEQDGTVWEQHEIELALAPLPRAADAVALTRWVVQNLARRHGLRCSFDPIVKEGHPGNGLHFHMSPVVGGEHVGGVAEDGTLPPPAKWLIAGLVQMGGALMAFGNRGKGSFLRLRQGKEAPSTVVWGRFDRQALIRLPITASTDGGRPVAPPTIEFRLPDGSAHPHLLLAGIAQTLVFGHETEELDALLKRTASGAGTARTGAAGAVPRSAAQSAAALERHRAALEAGGVFPPGLIDQMLLAAG